ncbi:MAG TPA: hypothetical protein VGN42_08165 [Pirellulales bacterium]|nr:hypothetical protein [Pirellulales bacterium]
MENSADSNVLDADNASLAYIGQWRGLVSTTNWEKGRIIHEWREALVAADANSQDYSDEAWSRRVGNVTGQHVGRLRRVYERFEPVRGQYAGLFWSHFQAAVEWPDAEMWLEGAVQSGWSINEMRGRRWEALGVPAEEQPRDEPIVESELDEDVEQINDNLGRVRDPAGDYDGAGGSRSYESEADYGDEPRAGGAAQAGVPFEASAETAVAEAEPPVRPFEHLAELPDDLADAFESYKLAILHHKLAGWKEISRGDVLASLDALKQLAQTPTEE